ncbi:DUF2075 domain-containing protein [Psychrobacter sp. 2Y5]|uniref:DUF2075 domain-containing protein n=1 Tax=unclassified Psychrobacter TaxID=196806 RepID=UPI003F4764FE
MQRAYYSNSIQEFLLESEEGILGRLTANHSNRTLEELQINAWRKQIKILKDQLSIFKGQIYFEFTIPRMGKRVDNIIIINNVIFIVEFKVGDGGYSKHSVEQTIDYTTDLKNFHEGSHHTELVPVLVVTEAKSAPVISDHTTIINHQDVAKTNQFDLAQTLSKFINEAILAVNVARWQNSIYKPTPTIVEAAQALYKGHNVKEITRSDSGAINLGKTTDQINRIIEASKHNKKKSICFITGVPGAGKTLAGLNIAVQRMNADEEEHAVFLSGNGPLVDVLREALTRDSVNISKQSGDKLPKKQAAIKANAFIQNIHHFRDDNLKSTKAPTEKVVVFDEAQRAWTKAQASSFMKRKKGIENFNMSEPEFLIEVMNRHHDWCTIVCLIGGGQEINTGEAGLQEWIDSLKNNFSDWDIHYSEQILDSNNYIKSTSVKNWLIEKGHSKSELHLAVSVRSFRSEKLAYFIHELLDLNKDVARGVYAQIKTDYPIFITRDIDTAKNWLRNQAKGSERIGLISSSGAKRLRPLGIDVKNEISAPSWFLNDKNDIRSSYFLEEVATEFEIQGLEIDWACVAWGGNFHLRNDSWQYLNFKGTKWQVIGQDITKEYLKNTYRVLLTRSRQGMVIFVPEGSTLDHTRPKEYYDGTWNYLKSVGIQELR